MENLSDLINRWQDTCYPGQGRPFKMHKYVSDQTIWLSDSRQGGAKIKTSRNRMESEIVLCSQLKKHDAILEKSAKLIRLRAEADKVCLGLV